MLRGLGFRWFWAYRVVVPIFAPFGVLEPWSGVGVSVGLRVVESGQTAPAVR